MTVEAIVAFLYHAAIEIIEFVSRNLWLLMALIILVLGSRPQKEDHGFHGLRTKLAEHPLNALKLIFQRIGEILGVDNPESGTTFAAPDKIIKVISDTNREVKEVLDDKIVAVNNHVETALSVIERDAELRPWRVVGAVLTAILLALFIYADVNQSVNNLALLLGEIPVPPWLSNLTLSIVVSSIGTIFTLALIMIDTIGITHFVPWERNLLQRREGEAPGAKSRFRVVAFLLAFVSILVALFCVIGLAAFRITIMDGIELSAIGEMWLRRWSVVSLSLVIVPMFIATILLYWGIMGLVVIYALFFRILALAMEGTKGLFSITDIFVRALGPATNLLTRLFVSGLAFIFALIGLVLGLLLTIAELITGVFELAAQSLIAFFSLFFHLPLRILGSPSAKPSSWPSTVWYALVTALVLFLAGMYARPWLLLPK